jgi:HTH-type transcriptional regulator / antitoxin HigA
MYIKPIRNKKDYRKTLKRIETLWNAAPNSPDYDELEVLSTLVDAYEERHYPIGPPDPIEAIRFRMEQLGLTRKDLEPYIGSRGRVSEVLGRKRGMSLTMIRKLHRGLGIPAEVLLAEETGR